MPRLLMLVATEVYSIHRRLVIVRRRDCLSANGRVEADEAVICATLV